MKSIQPRPSALELRPYQQVLNSKIEEVLLDKDEVCLAAGTGSGKTEIMIANIRDYLKTNPDAQVLVLTHGTVIIKDNAKTRFGKYSLPFSYGLLGGSDKDLRALSKQVVIGIPQAIHKIDDLPSFDRVYIDEAHQFVVGRQESEDEAGEVREAATMVGSIIRKCNIKKQIYLTATPSVFVKREVPIIPYGLLDALEAGAVSDPLIELGVSDYMADMRDFTAGEIDPKLLTRERTFSTLYKAQSQLLEIIHRRANLSGRRKCDAAPLNHGTPTKWETEAIGKTMIAAHDSNQAGYIKEFFDEAGVKAVISEYKKDRTSKGIKSFVKDPSVGILIVIFRGNLGFDFDELQTFVDMTETFNPNRLMQMLGRVVRKGGNGAQKLFLKLSAPKVLDFQEHLMGFVMMMAHKDTLSKWDGQFPLDTPVPKSPFTREPKDESDETSGGGERKPGTNNDKVRPLTGLTLKEFFTRCVYQENDILKIHAMTTLGQVRERYNGIAYRHNHANELLSFASINKTRPTKSGQPELFQRYEELTNRFKYPDTFIQGFKERFDVTCRSFVQKPA